MNLTPTDVSHIQEAFAQAFIPAAGIDAGWTQEVAERLRIQPLKGAVFFVFWGGQVTRPWDGTVDDARKAALESVGYFVAQWQQEGHKHGPHRWDIVPGTHLALGCRCESLERLESAEVQAYVESHLITVRQEGTASDGRALVGCPYVLKGWIYEWHRERRSLTERPKTTN